MSNVTRHYRFWTHLTAMLDYGCVCMPLLVFLVNGFVLSQPHQRYTLGVMLTIALMLVVIAFIFKTDIKTPIWIVVLGLYYATGALLPLIVTIAITTALSEFLFAPLHKHFKQKLIINKEIDKRGIGINE